jgi:hypothetical protein
MMAVGFMYDEEKIEDIFARYVEIEYDLRCIVKSLDVHERYYSDNGMKDMKDIIHLVKDIVEKKQIELRDNNENLDKELMKI